MFWITANYSSSLSYLLLIYSQVGVRSNRETERLEDESLGIVLILLIPAPCDSNAASEAHKTFDIWTRPAIVSGTGMVYQSERVTSYGVTSLYIHIRFSPLLLSARQKWTDRTRQASWHASCPVEIFYVARRRMILIRDSLRETAYGSYPWVSSLPRH